MPNLELFPSWPQDCIPSLQEGETLFSWCSLYHRVCAAISPSTTSKRLFGSHTSGFVRDFPARIDHFVYVTNSHLGTADYLIDNHTLFKLYEKFRPQSTMSQVRSMMRGDNVERLKFHLGLPSSRANASHPLKFCLQCVKDEVNENGIARWWVKFQWPTVWVCEKHNQLLHWVTDRHDGKRKISWILPSDLEPSRIACPSQDCVIHFATLKKLTALTIELADLESEHFSPDVMRLAFLSAIKERGWITKFGAIKYSEIRAEHNRLFGELHNFPGMHFIDSANQKDFGFISSSLRARSVFLHPSKYLVLICLLFENHKSFLRKYNELRNSEDLDKAKNTILNEQRADIESELKQLVITEGYSLNKAASTLNVSVSNVIAWAKKSGIQYERRPRLESKELLSSIHKLIEEGASRDDMSETLGVRRRWLTSFFSRNPELRDQWNKNNSHAITLQKRDEFTQIIDCTQGVPLNEAIKSTSSNYKWLLKNDKEWLVENLPALPAS